MTQLIANMTYGCISGIHYGCKLRTAYHLGGVRLALGENASGRGPTQQPCPPDWIQGPSRLEAREDRGGGLFQLLLPPLLPSVLQQGPEGSKRELGLGAQEAGPCQSTRDSAARRC